MTALSNESERRVVMMKKKRFTVKWPLMLPPGYLAGLFFLLVAIFLGSTLFEYHYRKSEIEHLMREEAACLFTH